MVTENFSISETGLEKIFLFPEKLRHLQGKQLDSSYPISIELSLTNHCNCQCRWCSEKLLRKRIKDNLNLETLKNLFTDIYNGGTKGVDFDGGGEPMLHPQFREIASLALDSGLAAGLITNGTMSFSEEIFHRFEWIRISLDAASPDQYIREKKVNLFKSVMENIRFLGERKKKTILGVGYVVNKNNMENLEGLIEVLKQYGVDYIQFRPVIDHPELLINADLSFLEKFETPGFKIDVSAMKTNLENSNAADHASPHSLNSVIAADGTVHICGRLNIHPWIKPIGNLHEKSFKEIWLGKERKQQVSQLLNPAFCKKYCPACRMTKYNILIDGIHHIKTRNFI